MKKRKSVIALITALCLCACCVPNAILTETNLISASADTTEVLTEGKCGENLVWRFDEIYGKLTISGTGEMTDFSGNVPWEALSENIKSVDIKNGVKSISATAFSCCFNLEYVNIPNTVITIGDVAFSACFSLSYVSIPKSVKKIGNLAFLDCGLISIRIENPNCEIMDTMNDEYNQTIPSKTTIIGYKNSTAKAYSEKYDNDFKSLGEAPEIITSGTCGKNLTWNFDETTGTLTISGTGAMDNWNDIDASTPEPSNVTSSDFIFVPWNDIREDITTIIIENGVTTIGNFAFQEFTSLKSVSIPDTVTAIGQNSFYSCSALESVILPDSLATIAEYAFYNCSALESIVILNSVTSIGNSAFVKCSALQSISIPDSVTTISNSAFLNCSALETIDVSENNPNYCSQDGILFDKEKTTLMLFPAENAITEYTIPDSVTTIGMDGFAHCPNLQSVTISDSVTKICTDAFWDCSIESIIIPKNVTEIGFGVFGFCSALQSITIENPDCEIYTNMHTISDTAIIYGYENSTAQAYAERFDREFISLDKADVATSGTWGENLTFDFDETTGILTIDGTGEMRDFNFYDYVVWKNFRENIKTVIINDGVTSIGNYAFLKCSNLESISIPESVIEIGISAFENCSALESITIPETVTTIGNDAFKDCSALQSIMIPENVTELGYGAFDECSNLESITILNPTCHFVERELPDCDCGPVSPVEDTIPSTTIIYGYENSTAQAYAEENGNEFISLDKAIEIKKGDVNGDNEIDIKDVVFINKAVLGKETLTEQQMIPADVDNDGYIKATDALLIMKYVVKLIDNFN